MNGTDILKVITDQLAVAMPEIEFSPTCYDPDKLAQKISIYGMERVAGYGPLYKRFTITVEDKGMLPRKKTSEEWIKEIPAEFKFKLLDPDGWDRGDGWQYEFHEQLITKEEFKKRLMTSTVQCNVGFFSSNW